MVLTLPTNVIAGDTGHINAHNTIHLATNGLIFSASAFYIPATSVSDSTAGHLMWASARGAASGVASLDGSTLLPAAQLPAVALRRDQANLMTAVTGVIIENYNTAAPFALLTLRGSRGTQSVPVANANNDVLAALFLNGQAGTTYGTDTRIGGGIRARATQAWGAGANGAQLEIFTYPNTSSGGVVTAVTIGQDQSAAFAADLSVVGNTTLTGTLTVGGVATFSSGIVAANAALIDGTTNLITGSAGQVLFQSPSGMILTATKDAGALAGSGSILFAAQGKGATDSAHTIGVGGQIAIKADASFSAGSSPGRIELGTAPSGSITTAVRALIDNAGKFWVGLTAAAAVASIDQTGLILSLAATGGIGYGTGAGGTVTQATSKVTGFTLSKPTGQITFAADALGANTTSAGATWTNTAIAANDIVTFNHVSGGTIGAYQVAVVCSAGSAVIKIRNMTGGSLSEAPVFAFAVLKSVLA